MRKQLDRVEAAQRRIEDKLDTLLAALADDGEEKSELDLEGNPTGGGVGGDSLEPL